MHSERGRKGLLLIVCAWTILTAGPGLTVYGGGTGTETQIRHWNIGDTVTRNIGGTAYRFRCIDQNYADHMDYHRKGALFLCDEVIPANTGSHYQFETPEDAFSWLCVCFGTDRTLWRNRGL